MSISTKYLREGRGKFVKLLDEKMIKDEYDRQIVKADREIVICKKLKGRTKKIVKYKLGQINAEIDRIKLNMRGYKLMRLRENNITKKELKDMNCLFAFTPAYKKKNTEIKKIIKSNIEKIEGLSNLFTIKSNNKSNLIIP